MTHFFESKRVTGGYARKLTNDNIDAVAAWVGPSALIGTSFIEQRVGVGENRKLQKVGVKALQIVCCHAHGTLIARPGDWVIHEDSGHVRVLPDIATKTK